MKTPTRSLILLSVTSVVLFSIGSVIGDALKAGGSHAARQGARRVTEMPQVISKVRHLEVTGAALLNEGMSNAAVGVEIRNNSDVAVMAVEISTRDKANSAAVTKDGLDDPDNPQVIIEPHGTITMKMGLGEMIPGVPLVVSGATFADGGEDGEEWSLRAMRAVRVRRKAQREARRGGPPE